jgi:hypothetical protein
MGLSVTVAVRQMKAALESKGFQVQVTPRAALDWPCFHCGRSLSKCRQMKNCCRRCKGKKDKFRAH